MEILAVESIVANDVTRVILPGDDAPRWACSIVTPGSGPGSIGFERKNTGENTFPRCQGNSNGCLVLTLLAAGQSANTSRRRSGSASSGSGSKNVTHHKEAVSEDPRYHGRHDCCVVRRDGDINQQGEGRMKIGMTQSACESSMRKYRHAIIASAIATILTACGGATEPGSGGTTGTTPDIGAAEGDTTDTDTDQGGTDSGSDIDETPDVDSEGEGSGDGQIDVDVDVDTSTDTEDLPDVDTGTDTEDLPDVDTGTDTEDLPDVDTDTDAVDIPAIDPTESLPDNALGLIQSHPDLGLFAIAIQSSGLVDYLADPEQRVTVFALPDKAFESLSAIQRDALFNDADRLQTLVRATTVPDTRITLSAAGVIDEMQTLSNGVLTLERDGEVISVAGTEYCAVSQGRVAIIDTVKNDEAAIHIIDDFTNIETTFFPPDPGSIMQLLPDIEDATFSNRLDCTPWYKELGNSELDWTVFLPEMGSYWDPEIHIMAREANDPIVLEAGTLTAVDGSSHVIENTGGRLTIDDIEISNVNELQVNNGYVHRIFWPLGDYASVLDRLSEIAVDTEYYNPESDENPSTQYRYAFFEELIRTTDEMARYEDRDNRLSLVIPRFGIMAEELDQRYLWETSPNYANTMYDTFAASLSPGQNAPAMVPDIFPDIESARTFLLSHTISGYVTEDLLEQSVGGYLATEAGTLLAVTEVISNDYGDSRTVLQLNGQPVYTPDPVANGTLLTSELAIAATPESYGWGDGEPLDPPDSVGLVARSLAADNRGFLEAFTSRFGSWKFDETTDADPWTIFAPTVAASDIDVVDYIITGAALSAQELIDRGSATTFGGTTLSFGGTADALTINGFLAGVVGDGSSASVTYSIETTPVAESLSVNNNAFFTAFANRFGSQKLDATSDADPWTIIAPTEAASDIDVGNYIIVGVALTAQELLQAGSVTTFYGTTLVIGGTADALTINGLPASVVGLGNGASGSITYSVEGAL